MLVRSEEEDQWTWSRDRSQMMLADNCRKFDIRVLNASILNSEYQYLSINRRFRSQRAAQVVSAESVPELKNLAIWSIKQ